MQTKNEGTAGGQGGCPATAGNAPKGNVAALSAVQYLAARRQ